MKRWVLLEHTISSGNTIDIHYDFLVEDKLDCFTWKLNKIPVLGDGSVEIVKQSNHRLVWLSRIEYQLSRDRGLVRRIDNGTFSEIFYDQECEELQIKLNGKLLTGLLTIDKNFCQLMKNN